MSRTSRKHYRRSPPRPPSEKTINEQQPPVSKREIAARLKTVANTPLSPAAGVTRYWLRDDTCVDLALPHEKIGVPFDPASHASVLTDEEKNRVIVELGKCEPAIRAGNLHVLELAFEICSRGQVAPPLWLVPHALKALNTLMHFIDPRTRNFQREIHQIRWAAVHYLRTSRGLTWEEAYPAAYKELYHTRARGSEETIRASYKWMNRHPFIRSMRQKGLPGEINDFAREQYENRQAASERLISLEVRRTKNRK
jgi:hypothetical protein